MPSSVLSSYPIVGLRVTPTGTLLHSPQLLCTYMEVTAVSNASSVGSEPCSWLVCRKSFDSSVSRPSSLGIVPVSSLELRNSDVSVVASPNSVGMLDDSVLLSSRLSPGQTPAFPPQCPWPPESHPR